MNLFQTAVPINKIPHLNIWRWEKKLLNLLFFCCFLVLDVWNHGSWSRSPRLFGPGTVRLQIRDRNAVKPEGEATKSGKLPLTQSSDMAPRPGASWFSTAALGDGSAAPAHSGLRPPEAPAGVVTLDSGRELRGPAMTKLSSPKGNLGAAGRGRGRGRGRAPVTGVWHRQSAGGFRGGRAGLRARGAGLKAQSRWMTHTDLSPGLSGGLGKFLHQEVPVVERLPPLLYLYHIYTCFCWIIFPKLSFKKCLKIDSVASDMLVSLITL